MTNFVAITLLKIKNQQTAPRACFTCFEEDWSSHHTVFLVTIWRNVFFSNSQEIPLLLWSKTQQVFYTVGLGGARDRFLFYLDGHGSCSEKQKTKGESDTHLYVERAF